MWHSIFAIGASVSEKVIRSRGCRNAAVPQGYGSASTADRAAPAEQLHSGAVHPAGERLPVWLGMSRRSLTRTTASQDVGRPWNRGSRGPVGGGRCRRARSVTNA